MAFVASFQQEAHGVPPPAPAWRSPVLPPCSSLEAAERALDAARERLLRLPDGGGLDWEARDLLLEAAQACPLDAKVQDEVGEGFRYLQEPESALRVFTRGARLGLWHHPLQRVVNGFEPGLRSARLLGPESYEELPELRVMLNLVQSRWAELRTEFLRARRRFHSGFVQIWRSPPGEVRWQRWPLRWSEGSWGHYYVAPTTPYHPLGVWYWDGAAGKCNWAGYPLLCGILVELRGRGLEVTQAAITEVRGPKTHIPAHRSQQWRLRLVCPLVVPRNSTSELRFPGFGGKLFEVGKCWWFDESYEHELFYQGPGFRSALILDLRHPGLDGRPPVGCWAEAWWNSSYGLAHVAAEHKAPEAVPASQPAMPRARAWTELRRRSCWGGRGRARRDPRRCCAGEAPPTCWSASGPSSAASCCGTAAGSGAAIPRSAPVPSTLSGASPCQRDGYTPSPLEAAEHRRATELALVNVTSGMCRGLRRELREAWLQQARGLRPPSTQIFSMLCRAGSPPELIEPLAGVLRDPRMVCEGRYALFFVDWLLLADASHPDVSGGGQRRFFDAGGSRFADALGFLLAEYAARGVDFHEVFVWEAQLQGEESYWRGTTPEVRKRYEGRLRLFDGIPITAEPDAEHNPVALIGRLCEPRDFCVLKLDIDKPSVERALVEQLLGSGRSPTPLVDELLFEHHVLGAMERYGWRTTWEHAGEKSNETLADSYALFSSLRELGIRAHSWI